MNFEKDIKELDECIKLLGPFMDKSIFLIKKNGPYFGNSIMMSTFATLLNHFLNWKELPEEMKNSIFENIKKHTEIACAAYSENDKENVKIFVDGEQLKNKLND